MHFLALKIWPPRVTTLTCEPLSWIEATGEERWMLFVPTSLASPLAIDCAPGSLVSPELGPEVARVLAHHL